MIKHSRLFRIVEGAVLNTFDAHPSWRYHPGLPRSIAKRAAGTLAAHLPGLAATKPSDRAGPWDNGDQSREYRASREGTPISPRRPHRHLPPLKRLQNQVGLLAGVARRDGRVHDLDRYIVILRLLRDIEREQ